MKIPKRTLKGPQHPSLAQLTQQCLESFQENNLSAAKQLCEQILRIEPKNLVGGLLMARIEYRSGAIDFAKKRLTKLCHEHPGYVEIWNDLCVVLLAAGELQQARVTLESALPATGHPINLAELYVETLLKVEEPEVAIEYFNSRSQTEPSSPTLQLHLADALRMQGQYLEAANIIEQLLIQSPQEESHYRRLTSIWRDAENREQLEQTLRKWLEVAPDNPVARHLLGSLNPHDSTAATRASDEYVRLVFDEFAPAFDQSLEQLDYQGPQHIQRTLEKLIEKGLLATQGLQVLDAGCGTGLCGPILKPYSHKLVGVDLSPKMLERARERGLYDSLIEGELTQFLTNFARSLSPARHDVASSDGFDLIVICDTLNYFGTLDEVLRHAFQCLKPQGFLIFTIETLKPWSTAASSESFVLAQHGRYLHAPDQILQTMEQLGYTQLSSVACELRKQAGESVDGTLICGQRS